jgi:hypothetical protein
LTARINAIVKKCGGVNSHDIAVKTALAVKTI